MQNKGLFFPQLKTNNIMLTYYIIIVIKNLVSYYNQDFITFIIDFVYMPIFIYSLCFLINIANYIINKQIKKAYKAR